MQRVVWGLRAAVAASARHRAGSRVPRPCPSPGRSARPRRVASGSTRSVSVGGGPSGGRRNGDRGAGRADPTSPPALGRRRSAAAAGGGWLAATSRAPVAGTVAGTAVRFAFIRFAFIRFVVAGFAVAGEVAVVGRRAPAVALVAGAIGPAPASLAVRGIGGVAVGRVAVGRVAVGGGGLGDEPPVGEPVGGGDLVEDVEVGGRPQPVHPLLRECPGLLVHPGAGVHVGECRQRLVGRKITAGQGGRAGGLTEHRHP